MNYFEQSRNYMVSVIGENRTKEFLKNAIFSLTTGSNDILNYVRPSIPFFGGHKVSPSTFQDYMVSNLTSQLKVNVNIWYFFFKLVILWFWFVFCICAQIIDVSWGWHASLNTNIIPSNLYHVFMISTWHRIHRTQDISLIHSL